MKKIGILFGSVISIGVLYGIYGSSQLFIPLAGQEIKKMIIAPGDRMDTIARNMVSVGLARDTFATELYLRFLRSFGTIKAGEYDIQPGTNSMATGLLFLRGVPKKEKIVTIIEGWTTEEIAAYLVKEGFQSADMVARNTLQDWSGQFPVFQGMRVLLEGFYFPDTYRVFADTRAEDVTAKALANFEKKVLSLMPAGTPIEKVYEIVTLASIIEKEVSTDIDRAMVADIFQRRMRIGMPLQSDATVNYVTGKGMVQPTIEDTQSDSPYNTYRVKGLPPGPICNPGLSSIRAVVNPAVNEYLFFLTTKDGNVIYSKTFDEHVKNKQRYL